MARRAAVAGGFVLALAGALGFGACASTPIVALPEVVAVRDDLPGLSNFAQVDAGLYRGAQPTAAGMEVLASLGVKTIVNLRTLHSDLDELEGKGFRHARIPCNAWHPEEEDVVRFLAIAADPANRPVFVHCEHGADRTGMMVAAYRVAAQGWSAEAAAAELPRFGFHPIWNGIRERVLAFDGEDLRRRVSQAERETLEIVP